MTSTESEKTQFNEFIKKLSISNELQMKPKKHCPNASYLKETEGSFVQIDWESLNFCFKGTRFRYGTKILPVTSIM